MTYETIKLAQEEGTIIITLNRPEKLNSVSKQMRAELHSVLQQARANEAARVIILTGNGDFSAGADLEGARGFESPQDAYNFSQEFQVLYQELENFPLPTIAAIDGRTLGGGCELALACDFRIAAETAKIGVPEVLLGGLPAAGGTQKLPRLVGVSNAKEMLYIGDPISAQEAWRIGLVNRIVPKDQLMEEAKGLAKKLATRPKTTLSVIKAAVNEGINMDLNSALQWEGRCLGFLQPTAKEGVAAFFARQKSAGQGS